MMMPQETPQDPQDSFSHSVGEVEAGPCAKNILVVDDTPDNLRLLVKLLSEQGYKIRVATDGPHALEAARAKPPDLILLDVMMPGMDGYEVCRQLKAQAETRNIPVLFLSALDQAQDKVKAFTAGGVDYITKPFHVAEVLARVQTHLALQSAQRHLAEKTGQLERVNAALAREVALRKLEILAREQTQEALLQTHDELETRVHERTAELSAANAALRIEIVQRRRVEAALRENEKQIQQLNAELLSAYDATLEGWAQALDLRDKETEGHSQRVVQMTVALARAMGMAEAQLIHLRRGALLHDIGKMALPDRILLKPGKLDVEEWRLMRLHPVLAFDMLSQIDFLKPALDIPYCHHEKWNGTGYPRALKGEEIPLQARIFAVVDVWDALRSDRIYRKGWSIQQAMEYIRAQAGKHFDPRVAQMFLKIVPDCT